MSRIHCARSILLAVNALSCLLVGQMVLASPVYEIQTLGLTDAEHTGDLGSRYSAVYSLNESSQIIGWSSRYFGGADAGQSTWFYDHGVTTRIGLTDAEHTGSDGYQLNIATSLSEGGQAIGFAGRYDGSGAQSGRSAWLYDLGTTTRIGFIDADYTSSDGGRYSEAEAVNDSGQAIGLSYRYSGNTVSGEVAWLYDHGTTTRIGFTDAAHTRSDGYQASWAASINSAGQVVGSSWRSGNRSAWLYDHGTTTRIGLIDAAQPNSDISYADSINAAGQVIGRTTIVAAASVYFGQSAWIYDHGATTRVGLTTAEHTRNDGYRFSQASAMNEVGQAVGFTFRFSGSTDAGRSAWIASHGVTTRLGFTTADYTDNNGYQYSEPYSSPGAFNAAGQVIGYSNRYSDAADMGRAAWLGSVNATTRLGLTTADYTRNDGYQFSDARSINKLGQVIGYSFRYDGSTALGMAGWFFDDDLNQTIPLVFSSRASDGYCLTLPMYLADDGTVVGQYELFNTQDLDLGSRAFVWSTGIGFHDLGSLVDGGLSANGWQYLYRATMINSHGDIVGRGAPAGYYATDMAFVMSPVPEPSTIALVLGALIPLALWSRRLRSRLHAVSLAD
jgi:hypothetical protein